MKAERFLRFQGVGTATGIEPRMPQRLARVDVADSRDAGLVEQELFQGPLGYGKQIAEGDRRELGRERVSTQRGESRHSSAESQACTRPK